MGGGLDGLPEQVEQAFVRAFRRAYSANFQYYDPEDAGHTAWNFGCNVHSSMQKFLREELRGIRGVAIREVRNNIEITFGDYTFRPTKLGQSAGEDVEDRFPRYKKTAFLMAWANMGNVPALDGYDWGAQTHYYIAHFGNPEDGCRAVFLCAPMYDWESEQLQWERCIPLYVEDSEVETLGEGRVLQEPPAEKVIDEDDLNIDFKDNDQEDAEEADEG